MKVHILTLGFDNTTRIMRTIDRFFAETDVEGIDLTYTVVDARYPYPNKAANTLNLCQILWQRVLADYYRIPIGLIILERNFGQSGNYNALRDHFEYADDDIIVFYDTDIRPNKPTWLKDKITVFGDPKTAFVTMNCSVTDDALKHMTGQFNINGIRCRQITFAGGWPTGAWRGSFFRGGVDVTHEFYGGTEYNIMCAWRAMGLEGYMMCDHDDLRDVEGWDSCYARWKASVIAVAGKQINFEEWLKQNGF